jgi:hypothetical protein
VLVGAGVGELIVSTVGDGLGVSVITGVSAGRSVGGALVSVGCAAWVSAITVNAAATAVLRTLSELIVAVGVDADPHADNSMAAMVNNNIVDKGLIFMS